MIDLGSSRLIPLSDAPDHLPTKRGGKRVHLATIHRWATKGVGGIRLEILKVGGAKYTSLEALQSFCGRLSAGGDGAMLVTVQSAPGTRSTAQRRRDSELAARMLDAAGA